MTLVAKGVATLEKGLEQDLEGVLRWANGNGLKLNTGKTKLLLLGRKRRQKELVQVKVEMGDEKIVRSKAVKCLGVVIDDELNWKEQVQNVRRKCFTGLSKIRRLRNLLPSTIKKELYNALVLPHMDYCSVVWQECSRELREKLERVQNYDVRLILSKPPWTHSEEMRQKLNWMTLERRRVMARLCMMHRCVLKEDSIESLSKRIQYNTNATRGLGRLFLPRPTN